MNEPTESTKQFPTGPELGRKQEICSAGPDSTHKQRLYETLKSIYETGELPDQAYQEAKGNDSPPAEEEYAFVTCPCCEAEVYEDETDSEGICDDCREDEEDYDDGQPSECQEWYDFDPDC